MSHSPTSDAGGDLDRLLGFKGKLSAPLGRVGREGLPQGQARPTSSRPRKRSVAQERNTRHGFKLDRGPHCDVADSWQTIALVSITGLMRRRAAKQPQMAETFVWRVSHLR
jgi:hypothetical protein